jgi:hypothetical protein
MTGLQGRRAGVLAALLSCALLSCTREESRAPQAAPQTPPPQVNPPAPPPIVYPAPPALGAPQGETWQLDQIPVPTTDEAYEQIRDDIDRENVDEELQRLMREIEGGA